MNCAQRWVSIVSVWLVCALLCSTLLAAQDETPTAVTVQNRTGDLPFSQTVGTGAEHVDIGSGNLIIDVPIISLPGRHMPFNYGLRYNALFWTVASRTQVNGQQTHSWSIERRPYVGGIDHGLGFTPTLPQLSWGISTESCNNINGTPPDVKNTASGYIYTDAGGGKHALPILQVSATSVDGGCFDGQNGTGLFQGFVAGEGIFAKASDIYSTPAVYLPDGTQVAWPSDNSILNPPATPDGWVPIDLGQYLDANGNSKCEPGGCTTPVDTLGKNPLTIVNGSNQILYKIYDSNGVQQTYTVNLGTVTVHTNFGIAGVTEAASQTRTVVNSIVLPNGTSYSFQYEPGSYGGLSSVILPTGAIISYTWATLSPPGNSYLTHRYVSNRTVTVGTKVFSWSFNKTCVDSGCFTVNTDVGDPLGKHTQYQHSEGKVVYAKVYDGAVGSTLLRQYGVDYNLATADPNALPIRITTTLKNGLQSKVEYDYDTTSGIPGNVSETREYGYDGTLQRRTHNLYGLNTNSAYLALNVVDKVTQQSIYDSTADTCRGVAGACAQTQYEYDNYVANDNPLQSTSSAPAPQHDYTGRGTSFTFRGNATRVKRWRNTDSVWLTATYSYDDLGNIRAIKDPLGHITSYDYGDSFHDSNCLPPSGTNSQAYVTQVTNAKSQHIQLTRYSCTGLVQTHKDQNDIDANLAGTTQTFDLMNRPLITNFVDGGQVSMDYHGDVLPLKSTKTTKITSALNLTVSSLTDGLGRTVQTSLDSDPEGVDYTDTNYDVFGRVNVSNPYRSTSDPTYGITTNLYDALGRAYQITKQDGSIRSVAYDVPTTIAVNADCSITIDEAGSQRGTCSDALGRLVEVDEPNPGVSINVNNKATLLTDGNFVLENAAGTGMWSTGTSGTNATSIYMQDDANLVLYIFKWQAGTYTTPSPGPFPAQGCNIGSYLMINQRINANQCLVSPHGQYMLFMASDGNFFIYDLAHNVGTWGPGTYGHPGAYAIMQGDGNLCVYTATNTYLWCSGTSGTNAERLNMEDDGRIIIYKSAWNSGTSNGQYSWTAIAHPGCDVGNSGLGSTGVLGSGSCLVSPNGRFELLMQGDGNLVIYDRSVTPNAALWSTGTATSPADPGYAMRTLYSYDVLGNLLRVDQKGTAPSDSTQWRTRTFTYDSLSRLLTATNPESGTITYSYDDDGELLMKTSPAPNQTGTATQTVSYCYDEVHRVTARDYSAHTYTPSACPITAPVVSYVYDSGTNAKGHLTSLIDQSGTANYTYNIMGRLATETRPIASVSKSTSYTYNLDGSVQSLTYPSGRVVTYTANAAGRLIAAVDGNGTHYITSASYNPNGSFKSLLNGSTPVLNQNFQYTPRLQLCRITALTSGTLPTSCTDTQNIGNIMDRGYDFHAGNGTSGSGTDNGNVFAITNYRDTSRSQAFTYDALNRLTSGWSAANTGAYSWGENYTIDGWGNLQISPMGGKAHGGNFTLSGNAQNRPTGLNYDSAGNLMTYLSSTYTYDQENRLSSTAGMSYTYDGNGERVLKSNTSTGAAVKRYWSMGGNTMAEGDGSGSLTAEYIYLGSKRIARIDLPANTVHYYLSDHLGSTSIVASAAGVVEEESDYSPFGTESIVTGPGVNELKFTSKRRDTESQLDYFGARYFDSPFGRFTVPDPLIIQKQKLFDPQQWNMYQYARNNPLRYTDPTGLYTTSCTQKDISKCDQNTQNFEKARQEALNSKDQKVVDAAKAYGGYGEKNKVSVSFTSKGKSHSGFIFDNNGKFSGINVTVNSKVISGITQDSKSAASVLAVADVAHEGSHVQTDRALVDHNFSIMFNISNRQSEIRAYGVSNSVVIAAGYQLADDLGKAVDLSTDKKINDFLNSLPPNPKEKLDAPIYQPPQ